MDGLMYVIDELGRGLAALKAENARLAQEKEGLTSERATLTDALEERQDPVDAWLTFNVEGKRLVTCLRDGTIHYAPGYEPDEDERRRWEDWAADFGKAKRPGLSAPKAENARLAEENQRLREAQEGPNDAEAPAPPS